MADFKKSIQAGLRAHADAEAKRREIRAVVGALSDQLKDATDGVLGVTLEPSFREKVRHLKGVIAVVTGATEEVTKIKYTALRAVRLVDPRTFAELAEFELEATGYPVIITASGVHGVAHDREALEHMLAQLMEHPDTGGAIQRLLDAKAGSKSSPSSAG